MTEKQYKTKSFSDEVSECLSVLIPTMEALVYSAGMDPETDLREVDFRGVNFFGSDIKNWDLENADLTDAKFDGALYNMEALKKNETFKPPAQIAIATPFNLPSPRRALRNQLTMSFLTSQELDKTSPIKDTLKYLASFRIDSKPLALSRISNKAAELYAQYSTEDSLQDFHLQVEGCLKDLALTTLEAEQTEDPIVTYDAHILIWRLLCWLGAIPTAVQVSEWINQYDQINSPRPSETLASFSLSASLLATKSNADITQPTTSV